MVGVAVGMHFNVSNLMREPSGSSRSVEVDDTVVLALSADRAPVKGTVGLMRTDRGVWVSAALQSWVGCVCSRCLEPLSQPVELSIDEEFLPWEDCHLPIADGDASYIDDSHILDLTEAVRQYLRINAPMKPVCSSDCLGLCPKCGGDLNEASCRCESVEIDSRWTALLELANADSLRPPTQG